MFRLWAKTFKNNKMLGDFVVTQEDPLLNRTKKIFAAIEEVCYTFDLGKPIWLESNIEDFKRNNKTRFYQDSFIEQIDFDYLEIHIIEEDDF